MYEELEFCGHIKSFYFDNASKSLLVFLPAANGKAIHPRYPRFKWAKDFSECSNVLYLSDPYQGTEGFIESYGSWYVDKMGYFILPSLARELKIWMDAKSITRVVFYGSSMGGYAAVILSSMINSAVGIAECPQLFLEKHPGSKHVLDNFYCEKPYSGGLDAIEFVKSSIAAKLIITCSVYDRHYSTHFLPFIDLFKSNKINLDAEFLSFFDPVRGEGHVVLQEKRSYEFIFQFLESS